MYPIWRLLRTAVFELCQESSLKPACQDQAVAVGFGPLWPFAGGRRESGQAYEQTRVWGVFRPKP